MIDLTMWVLEREGKVKQDPDGHLLFDTEKQARNYLNMLIKPDGWKPKRVRVTDAK